MFLRLHKVVLSVLCLLMSHIWHLASQSPSGRFEDIILFHHDERMSVTVPCCLAVCNKCHSIYSGQLSSGLDVNKGSILMFKSISKVRFMLLQRNFNFLETQIFDLHTFFLKENPLKFKSFSRIM